MFFYLFLFIFFLALNLLYFWIARKYNIVDRPNERSSHKNTPIRGSGVIFWVAGICYALIYYPAGLYFSVALTLLCAVSFLDDLVSVKNKIRIVFHLLAILILFCETAVYSSQLVPEWAIPLILIVATGILNAFNFMDGINGMTGLHNLLLMLFLQYINLNFVPFTNLEFIWFAIIPCVIFLFFNYRKQAICFLGDTGSMAIALWILCFLIQLMITTQSFVWIFFLSVYGVDVVGTIIYRIYLKKNIFKAHRMFFFQILSNELKIPQRFVSALYAVVNISVCTIITYTYFFESPVTAWAVGIISLIVLIAIFSLRFSHKIKVHLLEK
ncbi:MAG: UDP-GlcNAc--UDP-phosphate GlcNAc-1-phosphate transferase [Dysgonamonadaceae bacterium]|jgi:UDP-N-acetylmuramyl pentapeptide phosphotransferase/UDP-N-acetylglucosamine-1-phosphate transferase|nr:UDP-GlcNAc--UDP-phosphate GlcNAc-1-phosphate transferase [Dysgonamonadaceae bacterium]